MAFLVFKQVVGMIFLQEKRFVFHARQPIPNQVHLAA
jgi:hypothetical protein